MPDVLSQVTVLEDMGCEPSWRGGSCKAWNMRLTAGELASHTGNASG